MEGRYIQRESRSDDTAPVRTKAEEELAWSKRTAKRSAFVTTGTDRSWSQQHSGLQINPSPLRSAQHPCAQEAAKATWSAGGSC